jgi:purine-binding chemotaxis protein CheW
MSTQTVAPSDSKPENAGAFVRSGKFLTFFLSEEEYGFEILKVHEIIGLLPITRVPQTQQCLKGVVNLRGKVIPVVDLRLKFGMPAAEATSETCIIVVHIRGIDVGVIVDRVSEVIDIRDGEIEPAPSFGNGFNTDFILGIGNTQERVRILLNIDRVLPSGDLFQCEEMPLPALKTGPQQQSETAA